MDLKNKLNNQKEYIETSKYLQRCLKSLFKIDCRSSSSFCLTIYSRSHPRKKKLILEIIPKYEQSSSFVHTWIQSSGISMTLAIKKRAFGSPSITVANFTLLKSWNTINHEEYFWSWSNAETCWILTHTETHTHSIILLMFR